MTIPIAESWPEDTLPLPHIDYSGSFVNATLIGDDRSENILRKDRFRKNYQRIQVQWKLKPAQKELFEAFLLNDLDNSTAAFSIPLLFPKNTELVSWVVRFTEKSLESEYDDGIWIIGAELELFNELEIED